jgi:(+)-trans-carveol dehydrogenase
MADRSNRFDGKVVLVTGAARGQGRNHAVRFAEEGADIIALDLCGPVETVPYEPATSAQLAETVAAIEALDRRVVAREADVRDPERLAQVVAEGTSELGSIDVVVANAGIVSFGMIDALSSRAWQDMLDVNLTGVFNTLSATAASLRESGPGSSVVVTSSIRGVSAMQNVSHYNAAKHGVIGLTKTFAMEFGAEGIRANCVMPTQCATDMIFNEPTYALFCPEEEHPTKEQAAVVSRGTHVLPVDWIEPDDVSNVVLFLASEEARYVTGILMPVDCGALLL